MMEANANREREVSCIMTAFNEGALARVAIDSVLSQTFGDFELIIVDDGASGETKEVLHSYTDERVVIITRSNDGLSSARNRGISAATGKYICFLDADDTRPPWSFQELNRAAQDAPDCVFATGVLEEVRGETLPFYDNAIFAQLVEMSQGRVLMPSERGSEMAMALLFCMEHQSANKFLRRDFVNKFKLRFPPGVLFEDFVFHVGTVLNASRCAFVEVPTFTYFRRYGRPQITGTSSTRRFDSLVSCEIGLGLFAQSPSMHDLLQRQAVLGAAFKLLNWCRNSLAVDRRPAFDVGMRQLCSRLDPAFQSALRAEIRDGLIARVPWVAEAIGAAGAYLNTDFPLRKASLLEAVDKEVELGSVPIDQPLPS